MQRILTASVFFNNRIIELLLSLYLEYAESIHQYVLVVGVCKKIHALSPRAFLQSKIV